MPQDDKTRGDYEVGYGKPPKKHQFKKGQSGNPKGRPKKKAVDLLAIINGPVRVTANGKEREMSSFEAGFRKIAQKALKGEINAIIKFIRICEHYGVIEPAPAEARGGVIRAPKGVDFDEWVESVTEEIPENER